MKVKKIISDIFTTIVILLSVVLLTIGLIPMFSSYQGFYVATDSMYPAMKVGDLIFVREVQFEDVEVGDVLTFTKEGSKKWFSHRVVKINTEDKSFRTKGDYNNVADPGYTSFNAVVGRAEKKVPFLGFIPIALSTTPGKVALALVYIIYIAVEIENAASKKRKKG